MTRTLVDVFKFKHLKDLSNGQLVSLLKKQISELNDFQTLSFHDKYVVIQNWGELTRTIQKKLTKMLEDEMFEQAKKDYEKREQEIKKKKQKHPLKMKWKEFKNSVDRHGEIVH